ARDNALEHGTARNDVRLPILSVKRNDCIAGLSLLRNNEGRTLRHVQQVTTALFSRLTLCKIFHSSISSPAMKTLAPAFLPIACTITRCSGSASTSKYTRRFRTRSSQVANLFSLIRFLFFVSTSGSCVSCCSISRTTSD